MNNRGFTLIELILGMLILSLVFSLATPLFDKVFQANQLEADAQKLAWFLRACRQESVYLHKAQTVLFYTNGAKYKILGGTQHSLSPGIEFVGTTTFVTRVAGLPACIFLPTGAPSSGGTVTLKNKHNAKKYVIVNPVAGRVRVSSEPPRGW